MGSIFQTILFFGGAKAAQEADNILILQDKRLITPRGKKYLQVTKNRFSGDLGMFNLEFNRDCLSFASKKKVKPDQIMMQSNPDPSSGKENNSNNENVNVKMVSFSNSENSKPSNGHGSLNHSNGNGNGIKKNNCIFTSPLVEKKREE